MAPTPFDVAASLLNDEAVTRRLPA